MKQLTPFLKRDYWQYIYGAVDRGPVTVGTEEYYDDIFNACNNCPNPLIVECGAGGTTYLFFHIVCCNDGYLISCDTDPQWMVSQFMLSPRYQFMNIDCIKLDVQSILNHYGKDKIDILYMDAGTDYQINLDWFNIYDKFLEPGSKLICHDTGYTENGIAKSVMDYTNITFDIHYPENITSTHWHLEHRPGFGLTICEKL